MPAGDSGRPFQNRGNSLEVGSASMYLSRGHLELRRCRAKRLATMAMLSSVEAAPAIDNGTWPC
jgi:hypothetical protein